MRRSRAENDRTLVSIFINPTQFDEPSDLARYPRTTEADLEALRAEGTDFVLLPRAEQLYRDGFRYRMTEHECSRTLEGAHRPGHFDGVLTVVMKLLQIAQPERAYFGDAPVPEADIAHALPVLIDDRAALENEIDATRHRASLYTGTNPCTYSNPRP